MSLVLSLVDLYVRRKKAIGGDLDRLRTSFAEALGIDIACERAGASDHLLRKSIYVVPGASRGLSRGPEGVVYEAVNRLGAWEEARHPFFERGASRLCA